MPRQRLLIVARVVSVLAAVHFAMCFAVRAFPEAPVVGWTAVCVGLGWAACALAMAPGRRWAWRGALSLVALVCTAALPVYLAFGLPLLIVTPYFCITLAILLPSNLYLLLATPPDP